MAAGWPKQIKSDEEEKGGRCSVLHDLSAVPITAGTPLSACQSYSIGDGSRTKIVLKRIFVGILILQRTIDLFIHSHIFVSVF